VLQRKEREERRWEMSGLEIMALKFLLGRLSKYLKKKAVATPNKTDDKLAGALELVVEVAKEVEK
jgi:hypothetical protein